ncbi:hypothetical protein D9756_002061 [Leucocoprinus leucothites]|uniref:Nephrocystin 3-like N-terminal domain-containing protein n=1 Tax=Leucocoprinus leucothites TaxID=201217 RepID=A0A8H5LM72_9AGAR|nr:hypothetical protein D9756_002061 [Leucoagaricus leucothites]
MATTSSHLPDSQSKQDQSLSLISNAGVGTFKFTHSFLVNNPNVISRLIRSDGIGLHILAEGGMIGVEVDASKRMYQRRSFAATRKNMRGRVLDWAEGRIDRAWRMIWIMGPGGVGKSSIAQKIADAMRLDGRLGCCLFFSPRHNDSTKIMATLAYQLAVKHAWYKHIVTKRLADDPNLLERPLHIQFRQLIIHPFQFIMTHDPSILDRPLLIILDGVDKVKGEIAQCELIEIIAEHVRCVQKFPLLWLICSKPEWYFKYLVSQTDFPIVCEREELKDETEARQGQDDSNVRGPAPGRFVFADAVMRYAASPKPAPPQADPNDWQLDCVVLGPMGALEQLTRDVQSRVTDRDMRTVVVPMQ